MELQDVCRFLGEQNLKFYVYGLPDVLNSLLDNLNLDLEIVCINPEPKTAEWYRRNITELNVAIYGKKGMPTIPWVDANFGEIAGITLGFMKDKEVITMIRACGSLMKDVAHLWTFATHPSYRGLGLGKLTLVLCLHLLSKQYSKVSYITQLEDVVTKMYVKLMDNLRLVAIGFHHTHLNSYAAIADIPRNPLGKINNPNDIVETGVNILEIDNHYNSYLLIPNNTKAIAKASELLKKYSIRIVGWNNGLIVKVEQNE